MSGIVLTLRQPLTSDVDLGSVFEGPWTSLPPAELAGRRVRQSGHEHVALSELFEVHGSPDGTARIEGDLSRASHVGARLAEGRVTVEGNVGDAAGQSMSGGALIVHGSAGARVGGAEVQSKRGMTGGEIVVAGNSGPSAGHAMRRGLIAIGGNCGPAAGFSMLAGTIVALGNVGAEAGLLNRRGSVVAFGTVSPVPTYRYACEYRPHWLRTVLRRLRTVYGFKVTDAQVEGRFRRYSGDFAELARGEILAWSGA